MPRKVNRGINSGIKRAVTGEVDLEFRVVELSLIEPAEKKVRINLKVQQTNLYRGLYSIVVSLKKSEGFKLGEDYPGKLGSIMSADSINDDPRKMDIGTMSSDILELRDETGNLVYQNPEYKGRA